VISVWYGSPSSIAAFWKRGRSGEVRRILTRLSLRTVARAAASCSFFALASYLLPRHSPRS